MASPPNIEDPAQINHRAKVRIGIALALLFSAIAILVALNHRGSIPGARTVAPGNLDNITSAQVEMPPAATQPTPNSISSPPPVVAETPTEPPPPPITGSLPPAQETAPAEPSATPALIEKSASAKPATRVGPATAEVKSPARPVEHPAAARPAPPPPAPVAAPKFFQVQVGVFSDPENAKQLQARLAEHGIPSHLETRLQVGPFKTQAEAEAAREKLKALGINAVIAH